MLFMKIFFKKFLNDCYDVLNNFYWNKWRARCQFDPRDKPKELCYVRSSLTMIAITKYSTVLQTVARCTFSTCCPEDSRQIDSSGVCTKPSRSLANTLFGALIDAIVRRRKKNTSTTGRGPTTTCV